MNLINTVKGVQEMVTSLRKEGKSIGFVPTMGALHEGHLSLVKQCISDNDICIVSIFVNPTQFNNKEDLLKYPRNLEKDCLYLEKAGVHIVFAPSVEEIYPEPDTRQFDFGQIDKVMEGEHRPGHFNGVAQVVSRLFDVIKPNKAYFGEKDFQQLAIIREMVKQLELDVEIVPMPIVREATGLALSSRNERLNPEQKQDAVKISEIILGLSKNWNEYSVNELKRVVIDKINEVESLQVEYFEIVDGFSLQPIQHWPDTEYAVGCIAVFCGDVRLIDNVTYY
ncbi:pantoate--beta-alanine ligase [Dysgonomonas sp. Marseille-P4677]|uniref:pantoate--beta-alanine ligase n=1 Tax=Dysgonomonas sp. Marseille-P4677 TaxID=2364790 RepID=UPI00191189AF|nr:pantoate--beta-alanine ligase [Dysgonomonas sp. Marseille-P4677]MBK5719497.1 pantoate--beta-alanine ligase [Dysgonomonas sp. Marseille-P4677]